LLYTQYRRTTRGSLVLLLSRARNFNFNEYGTHAQIKIKNGLVTAPGLVSNYA
jgi:hypothetical protein